MTLLDLYRSRYGQAVRRQGEAWNGPCPFCGGEPGKSDRFMVWPDRRESNGFSRGHMCIEKDIPGAWHCRRCGKSGDTIAYMLECEGMSWREVRHELGLDGTPATRRPRRRPAPVEPVAAQSFQPVSRDLPSGKWQEYAGKLAAEGMAALPDQPQATAWLLRRGLPADAWARYGLGWIAEDDARHAGRFRRRSALGLAPKVVDGREKTTLFIPRGISIPTFDASGHVVAMRIRRPRQDMNGDRRQPKYLALEGGSRAPFLLPSSLSPELAVYFVVEAELDAMLIHHVTGGVIGALALRSNRTKPDAAAHAALRRAQRICLALDYDDAGAEALPWWYQTYGGACRRWPVPEGKDPGDAVALGVDIRGWIAAGLPPSVALPEPAAVPADRSPGGVMEVGRGENGENAPLPSPASGDDAPAVRSEPAVQADTCAAGGTEVGGGGTAPNYDACWLREGGALDQLPAGELALITPALPSYLSPADVPLAVGRAWLLWRELSGLRYVRRCPDEYTRPGWGFPGHVRLPAYAQSLYDELLALYDGSFMLRTWLHDHRAALVTARNLFNLWGDYDD